MNNCDFLYHYGTLGMKWGVRRYQNKDGTLTKAGIDRYKSSKKNAKSEFNLFQKNAAKLNSAHAHYGLEAQKYLINAQNGDGTVKNGIRIMRAINKQREVTLNRIANDKAAKQLVDGILETYGDAVIKTGYTMYRSYKGTEMPTSVAKLKFKRG